MKKTIGTIGASLLGAMSLANLDVVTTTQDLASIASAVGGSSAKVTPIVTGNRDPHFIDAKPGYMSLLRNADLFIVVGLDLEIGYAPALINGARNSKIQPGRSGYLQASEGISVLEKPSGSVSRAQGDVHPYGNPHYWLDPFNARVIADRIADRMSQLDPSNKAGYQQRAAAFARSVDNAMFGSQLVGSIGAEKLWSWSSAGSLAAQVRASGGTLRGWASKMEPLRGDAIVTYHRSWTYFASRFGLRIVEELEPKPGIAPTPGHLARVIATINRENVRVVLQEPFYSKNAGETIRSRTKAGLAIVPLTVGSDPAARDYVGLIDTIVTRVTGALE